MGALGKNGIKALFLTYDPNTELLLKFLADLPYRVVGGQPSFERLGGLEKNSGKGGAKKSQKTKPRKDAKTTPTKAGEEVPAGPNPPLYRRRSLLIAFCHRSPTS